MTGRVGGGQCLWMQLDGAEEAATTGGAGGTEDRAAARRATPRSLARSFARRRAAATTATTDDLPTFRSKRECSARPDQKKFSETTKKRPPRPSR